MFNQQQQFHQLMQLQHILQQQQQHPAQHHSAPRSMAPSVQHQQPQQVLNLRAANPARLMNTHPMLQHALLMQHMQAGNLRGLSMAAPTMSPFFTAAARQSILGTPPMGVTVKAPRMGFPGLPFQQPQRMYHKDHYRSFDRKKDGEQGSTALTKSGDGKQSEKEEVDLPPAASEADEESENLTECSVTDPTEPSAKRARSNSDNNFGESDFRAGGVSEERESVGERSVESQLSEGVSAGQALKVTIQQRSESRTISTTAMKPAHSESGPTQGGPRFCCYICKSNFQSLQAFQAHLLTARHHQRFQEIQHLSDACLVTLMPTAKDTVGRDGKTKQQRWCNVCQVHFSSDLITHLRTQQHKLGKRSLRPFCTVCSRHFKTPRKFVEHMKSPEHKQKSQEVRLHEKESWSPEESEELITVDAVGCFEEDEDDEDDEEEGISADESDTTVQCISTERDGIKLADEEHTEEYNADKAYGLDFMAPVTGYLCKLCHKFYSSDSVQITHCQSLMHFQNLQRYKAAKNSVPTDTNLASDFPKPESPEGIEAMDSPGTGSRLNTKCTEQMNEAQESLHGIIGSRSSPLCLAMITSEDVGTCGQSQSFPSKQEMENEEEFLTFQQEPAPSQEEGTISGHRRSSRHKLR